MENRTIEVKDQSGKLIAVFSNKTPAQSNEDKKNLMISPTIDIVQNGESTLSFQMFVTSQKWQDIKDPRNLYYCNGRVYTPLNEQSYVYSGQVVNVTLVELWYLLSYRYVQAHNVDTTIEALDDHTVKILPKTDQKFKLTVNGVQYDDSQVKDSRGVLMPRGSAGYALWAILKGTDWTLGVCDVLPEKFDAQNDYGSFNVESDMKDVLYNIQLIQSLYGGVLVWDSMNKIVHLRDESIEDSDFNTWQGFSIRKGKNLSEYPTITWDNNLITRLYPLGNGNLNIKRINNEKGYIDDFSYTSEIYEGYLQNSNIYDTNDEGGQKTLKYWGDQQIKKYCKPRKSISYNITDPQAIPEQQHEKVDISHIVKSYYQDTESGQEVWEFLRVQHITRNWFSPGADGVLEVGDKISDQVELFYQVYKQSQNSAPTDASGHLSGNDIYLEVPEEYWDTLFGGGFGYASLQTITNLHAEHETENTLAIADLRVYADDTFATITSFTSFQEWTEEEFKESSTRIDQVSTALSAQIELEAAHHEESLKYTQDSVANLKLYVDGDFAQAQLSAAYSYTNSKTNEVSNALASFEAYADSTYAKASVAATFDYVNSQINSVNSSIASVSAQASRAEASVNAIANSGMGSISYVSLQQSYDYPKAEIGVTSGSHVQCAGPLYLYSPSYITCQSPDFFVSTINSRSCSWKYSSTLGGYYLSGT